MMDAIERHRWNAPRVVVVQIPSGTARHVGMLVSSTQPTIFGGACLVLVPFDGTQTGHQITVVGMIGDAGSFHAAMPRDAMKPQP
jgi:hypothetical protein